MGIISIYIYIYIYIHVCVIYIYIQIYTDIYIYIYDIDNDNDVMLCISGRTDSTNIRRYTKKHLPTELPREKEIPHKKKESPLLLADINFSEGAAWALRASAILVIFSGALCSRTARPLPIPQKGDPKRGIQKKVTFKRLETSALLAI